MNKLSVFISLNMCLHTHTLGILPHTPEKGDFAHKLIKLYINFTELTI